jgi:hypothetical protein
LDLAGSSLQNLKAAGLNQGSTGSFLIQGKTVVFQ